MSSEQATLLVAVIALLGTLANAGVSVYRHRIDARKNKADAEAGGLTAMAQFAEKSWNNLCEQLTGRIDSLTTRIQDNEKCIAELRQKLEESQVERVKLVAEIEQLRVENRRLTRQVEELRRRLSKYEKLTAEPMAE